MVTYPEGDRNEEKERARFFMHSLFSLVIAFGCCGERYGKKEKGNKTSHSAESLLRQSEINALLKIILLLIIC